jgi:ribonuclease HI
MASFFEPVKEKTEFIPEIYVYTDGACSNNGKRNAKAGLGVFFGEDDSRNCSKIIEGRQTNNVAELSAIIEAYHILKKDIEAHKNILICSDSKIAIGWCTTTGRKYANNNWKKKKGEIPNVELIKKAYALFNNQSNIQFLKVAAHTNGLDEHSIGNDGADKLANLAIGVTECPYKKIYLDVPFFKKDLVKKIGAKWDRKKKKWYIMNNLSEEKKEAINNILND